MNIPRKTPDEIEKMREAGRQAAAVFDMITPHVVAGVSTGELDRLCHDFIVKELGSTRHRSTTTASPSRSAPLSTTSSATVSPTSTRSSSTATS